jgi:ubiquinone biosynthesis protein Coq4
MYNRLVIMRSWLLVYLTHKLALPVLKLIRRPEVFPYTREALKSFPGETLGRHLIEMLEDNNLQLLTHYAKHDMKHILLDYPTTDKGEVCLQAFMLGNRHLSFPVVISVTFGALLMPEHWGSFIHAFRRGRAAKPIAGWNWAEIVHEKTKVLKRKIFNA